MDKEDHLMNYVLRRILSIVLLAALCLGSVYAYAEEDAWNCRDCGAANTGNFCIKCGAKRPEEIICPEWRPKAQLYVFHSTKDNVVTIRCAEHLRRCLTDLPNITYDFGNYGSHTKASAKFFKNVVEMINK